MSVKNLMVEPPVNMKEKVVTKRLTIDLPASLHTRLKIESAKTGQTMAEIIKVCLEKTLTEKGE